MMDNVFYQGETIPVVISGDEKTDLRMYNFVMLVYLHYDSKDFQLYYKHDFTEEYVDGETKFRCVIPHQTTGEMTQAPPCPSGGTVRAGRCRRRRCRRRWKAWWRPRRF